MDTQHMNKGNTSPTAPQHWLSTVSQGERWRPSLALAMATEGYERLHSVELVSARILSLATKRLLGYSAQLVKGRVGTHPS